MIRVLLRCVTGGLCELEVAPQCDGATLKTIIASHFQVPPSCQKLILGESGESVLCDSEPVGALCKGRSTRVCLTMLITLDKVCMDLHSGSPTMQKAALGVLAELILQGEGDANPRLDGSFEEAEMGRVAEEALARAAEHNNACTTGARLSEAHGHSTNSMHCPSMLPQDTEDDDDAGIAEVLARLRSTITDSDNSMSIGCLQMQVSPEDVSREAPSIVDIAPLPQNDAARRSPEDAEERFGSKWTPVLNPISAGEEDGVATPVTTLLQDQQGWIRCAATEALGQVAQRGDLRAVSRLEARLEDQESDVRCAAVGALAAIAPEGDARAIVALTARARDSTVVVRRAALEALSTMAGTPGASAIVTALRDSVEDMDASVRRAAVQALAAAATGADAGDGEVEKLLAACLSDPAEEVRSTASAELAGLVARGNQRAAVAAMAHLDHPVNEVRVCAVGALGSTATVGVGMPEGRDECGCVLGGLVTRLHSPDASTRLGAVEGLITNAARGDEAALSALGACLADPNVEVRNAAMTALGRVTQGGDDPPQKDDIQYGPL